MFIKKNKSEWKNIYKTPYDYISKEYNDVYYIRDFFKKLHSRCRCKKEKDLVKELTNCQEDFCDELTKQIEEMCDSFFGLNIDINSNEEW